MKKLTTVLMGSLLVLASALQAEELPGERRIAQIDAEYESLKGQLFESVKKLQMISQPEGFRSASQEKAAKRLKNRITALRRKKALLMVRRNEELKAMGFDLYKG